MKQKIKYAVVADYTFDEDTVVYLFDTYEEAKEYMQNFWEWCYNDALTDENFNEEESYHEDDYAVLKWGTEDDQLREFTVTATSEPLKF